MATKGIKRIRIHSKGEEGINNTRGLRDIKSLDISHPIGVKPSAQDFNVGVDTNELIGGNEKYTVFSVSQRDNEFLLSTEVKDILLYQNYFPDTYFSASAPSSDRFIELLGTTGFPTARNTDIVYQYSNNKNYKVLFNRDIDGNNAGWWDGQDGFRILELPNTAFRVTGSIVFKGVDADTSATNYYLTLKDSGYLYGHGYNYTTGAPNGVSARHAGFLPPKKMVVSASSTLYQTESFDFLVTQSHSRIWDVPLGPSYNPTKAYYLGTIGGNTVFDVQQTEWSLHLGGDQEYGNSGYARHLTTGDSKLIIEPITIIDPTDATYTETPPGENTNPRQLSGSIRQASSREYLETSYKGLPTDGVLYKPGDIISLAEFRYLVLAEGYLPNASPPNDFYEQTYTGRISTFEVTGSIRNTAWEKFTGWRYASVTTTSSLVPINNNDDVYDISDFNPVINNAVGERPSEIYYDVDYTRGIIEPLNRDQIITETATHATVEDSNYSRQSWSSLRYNGSRVTSNNINNK